eukprot:6709335-Pyramimonas_sp.AAC.1
MGPPLVDPNPKDFMRGNHLDTHAPLGGDNAGSLFTEGLKPGRLGSLPTKGEHDNGLVRIQLHPKTTDPLVKNVKRLLRDS